MTRFTIILLFFFYHFLVIVTVQGLIRVTLTFYQLRRKSLVTHIGSDIYI